MPTDQELVAALRTGDTTAFAHFFNTYAEPLFRLSAGLLHDEDEAEDVVQETFLKLLTHLDGFEGRSRLNTWLYRVAYNASISRLRRQRPQDKTISTDDILDDADLTPIFPHNLAAWKATPEEILADTEARAELDRAIAELPELLRAVFLLRDIEGLSTAETAAALGISQGAAKVRLHRARLALREKLADYFGERYGRDQT